MALRLLKERGVPIERQRFTLRELSPPTISKIDCNMVRGTEEFGPTSRGGPDQLAENRIRVAQASQPAATMPSSLDVPVENLALLDKLGARLHFERTGVRLYLAIKARD